MSRQKITTERCADYCGHPSCNKVWLVGMGSFVQGSGFTPEEAEEIVHAVNSRRRAGHVNYIVDDGGHHYRVTLTQYGRCLGVWRQMLHGETFVSPTLRRGRHLARLALRQHVAAGGRADV